MLSLTLARRRYAPCSPLPRRVVSMATGPLWRVLRPPPHSPLLPVLRPTNVTDFSTNAASLRGYSSVSERLAVGSGAFFSGPFGLGRDGQAATATALGRKTDGWGRRAFSETRVGRLKKTEYPTRPTVREEDIEERFLKGSGPGGQKINKTNSAVQLRHIPTGIVIKSQATRSREQNRAIARSLLAERLQELHLGEQSRTAVLQREKGRRKERAERRRKAKYLRLRLSQERDTLLSTGDIAGAAARSAQLRAIDDSEETETDDYDDDDDAVTDPPPSQLTAKEKKHLRQQKQESKLLLKEAQKLASAEARHKRNAKRRQRREEEKRKEMLRHRREEPVVMGGGGVADEEYEESWLREEEEYGEYEEDDDDGEDRRPWR